MAGKVLRAFVRGEFAESDARAAFGGEAKGEGVAFGEDVEAGDFMEGEFFVAERLVWFWGELPPQLEHLVGGVATEDACVANVKDGRENRDGAAKIKREGGRKRDVANVVAQWCFVGKKEKGAVSAYHHAEYHADVGNTTHQPMRMKGKREGLGFGRGDECDARGL